MSAIVAVVSVIKNLFKYHKKKIFLVFVSAILFIVLLFPYNDLSGLIISQVSKATNNKVFLNFDKVAIHLVPTPGLKLTNVSIDIPTLSPIWVEQISVSPSLLKLLSFSLNMSLSVQGIWGGQLGLTGELEDRDGVPHVPFVAAKFKDVRLKELLKVFGKAVPVEISGQASGRMELSMKDPDFKEQPRGKLEVTVKDLRPPSSVTTSIGPLKFT